MSWKNLVKVTLVSCAALGCCMPPSAWAADAASQAAPAATDVALLDGAVLLGQVVDPQGVPVPQVPVLLLDKGQELARTQTDATGYFAVKGLRGGTYQIVAADGRGMFRLWKPGTAPPSAEQGALVVAGQDTVRGQMGRGLGAFVSNPWIVAAVVGAAVAVPVAIHNSQRPSSP